MNNEINAKVTVGEADESDISGTIVNSASKSLSKINADVEVTRAKLSRICGATFNLSDSDIGEVHQLKQDFQALLDELSKSDVTKSAKVATPAIEEELERKPSLKQRLLNAFKVGGMESLKVIFDHPIVSISTETIKAFLENS